MEPKHFLAQLVGFFVAAAAVAWAVAEHRRCGDRVPLIAPFDLRFVGIVLAWTASLVPILYVVFALELVPKGSPLLFVTMLAWVSTVFIAGLMALLTRWQQRAALGWLTFIDERTLRVEAEASDETIVLEPGSVRAYFTGRTQMLQFELTHGDRTLHLVAMAPLRDLDLATEGVVVPARGPMIGVSSRRFCRWVRPYMPKR